MSDKAVLAAIRQAWIDGFMASGDGFNGEFPFENYPDGPQIYSVPLTELDGHADEYMSEIETLGENR